MSKLPVVSIAELLDAGVHFGHKTARWNPKMAPYIYGIKDDIHIINLQQTAALIPIALNVIYETVKNGGKVLFVSTKVQASDIVAEYAEKCGQYYVNHRWLGGMLTNWGTISRSIKKLDNLEKILNNEEEAAGYTKKEALEITRKKDKLIKSLGGIRNLHDRPDLLVIIDTNKEHLAVKEAVKLEIPMVAVVDTNSDPDAIQFPIPGNDDAMRSIRLYCQLFAKAVLAGVEDALVASGVDIGAMDSSEMTTKNISSITKFKQPKRVSKATAMDVETRTAEEFEIGLQADNKQS
ncbi:30S ribosomal protein S2 [Candidatus Trichorickettsia mobilis]|uniref:Small ribosomal subunit protein uS2 n=1 Tax=Candidatus Trichorickettsia mobilis TaxID=1346319 RepID=A0ABZ0UUR2_9RICK|nr:30S ribosomal protein S2 [Candidatus Trichorickettsia mobilis]WPY01241.1 30S ribosomal protein S2 [Candidatus Trichorickettsia mobilis]